MNVTVSSPRLEVRNLERRYGGRAAVTGLSFALQSGEVLALLGPNGAGKTTTLSLISGNLVPHAGSIRIADHDLLARPRAAKRALGYLPEQPPLYPELSVNEYLGYCARLHGIARRAAATAVAATRERCGLGDVGRRLIGQLSKGYRQRVGLAQALIHDPSVLVLDEPTVGLDPVQVRDMRELIRSLARQAAVVVSTHLLAEAGELATRVMILHHGRVVHDAALVASQTELRLRFELAHAPKAERLANLPGIAAVEAAGPGNFVITAAAGSDPRSALARAALEGGWGLLALAPFRPSLEQTFLSLTAGSGEAAA